MERRPIPGCVGYEADDSGHVWSTQTNWRNLGARQLAEHLGSNGRLCVHVQRDGRYVNICVHKLVALAFYGAPRPGQITRHLNGNPLDNRPENLAWGTYSQNNGEDRIRHGTALRGEFAPQAKLTSAQIAAIRWSYAFSGCTQQVLADIYGVSQSTISNHVLGLATRGGRRRPRTMRQSPQEVA